HGAALTYHQLGRLAAKRREFDTAEGLYRQALEVFERFQDQHNADIVKRSFARLEKLRREMG
ncbi:MAG: hypothetical protein LBE83_02995, partial [Propionibacteriaceae bacterium]|nr:hypothetical protein [Propionibacteriaceae bacterium]